MKKIRIVQIGIAHDHAEPTAISLKRLSDDFELVGYFAPEEEKRRYADRLRVFEGYPELSVEQIMSDPTIDAVAIETAEKDLAKYALMAARAGKHVQMDKPGGMELSEFDELVCTVKEKKMAFQTGYMYRYNPYIKNLIERAKNGELGEIFSVEAHMSCRHSVGKRQWLAELGKGGMTFFLGCHLIDIIYQILGEPERIIPLTRSTGIDSVTANDYGMVVLEYKNGVSFIKTTAEERGGVSRRQVVVTGSKGSVEIKPLEKKIPGGLLVTEKTEWLGHTDNEWNFAGEHFVSESFDRYIPMLLGFAELARGERENPFTPDYELELYKLLLRCCDMM